MNRKMENSAFPRRSINYLFFGFYFTIIAIIHVFHIFIIEPATSVSTCFFIAYAVVQSAMETVGLMFIASLIIHYLPKLKTLFILGVFFLFIGHLIDFPLVRMMDMTFWHAFNFISQMSYTNFLELLLASNVSIFIWVVAGVIGISILFSGIILYHYTEKWTKRHPITASSPMLCFSLCLLCLFLVGWDFSFRHHVPEAHFDRFQKTLPWKFTFFPPKMEFLSLRATLQEPHADEELMGKLDSRVFSLARKPDVYLFIVESLRADYINLENSPNLYHFKKKNLSFDLALSNANATHISWFSLFHSQFPFYWAKKTPREMRAGSMPLQILKKMGYKIHVSSSSRLSYFQMNRLIFGEGDRLADTMFISEDVDCVEPYERDRKAMDNLFAKMQEEGSGRLFIVFLDATHLDYSWPREMTKFFPFEEKINYLSAAISKKGLEKIKNRYKNALYFADDQLGRFFEALETAPGGKAAVVVIAGDHGEEFYEHGHLFHASSLTEPQIRIPLFYRFGQNPPFQTDCKMTSHMDIFPTVFHYLLGEELMGEVLQGESIFKKNRWPYTIIARFNAISSPYEFCIHNGSSKLLASFKDKKNIFNSKGLKIISTKNSQDETILRELTGIYEEFGPAFERIFSSSLK